MQISDPISDMLTRIRNGLMASKSFVMVPSSSVKKRVLDVLVKEGYLRSYSEVELRTAIKELKVELKYDVDSKPVIRQVKRISRPGLRRYSALDSIPNVFNRLGINIMSTSKGVISDIDARKLGVGGEILCSVF